jgi:3-dehydroquinate dehydratase-1
MICVSLAGLSYQECLKAIDRCEFAEIRIDLLDIRTDQFKDIFSVNNSTIATCRNSISNNKNNNRTGLLKMAILSGANYVDIEYEAEIDIREEVIEFAHKHNCLVILSYHNYENTPPQDQLELIIKQSKHWNADLVKIVTTALNEKDCSVVMSLYSMYDNIIAFCMGEYGRITRVAAPFLGAKFTYTAYNNNLSTAPGQLTVDEMEKIYAIINSNKTI